jgi:hypothetical protein
MRRTGSSWFICLTVVVASLGGATSAGAQQSQPTAWDGQTLSGQSADVQTAFSTVWGDKAAPEWANEHSLALLKQFGAAHGLTVATSGPGTTVIPDGPPIPADTTPVTLTTTKTNAPTTGDLIDIDQGRHRLYVGHAATDSIEVFDVSTSTPQWLKSFHVPGGVAGILIATDIQKVFGGSPNGMVIVDADPSSPTYGVTLNTIFLGPGGTDELDYDPVAHKVYVTDVGDHTVASVNATTNQLIKAFTGLPEDQIEQPRYNPSDGMIYVNFRATNTLAKFDPNTDTLVSTTKLSVPCTPSGIAIKPTTNMALLGCRNSSGPGLVFWNLTTNALDHQIPNVSGADQVIYNAKADRFFAAASRWHRGAMMGIMDGSGKFITNVPTTFASHQVGYDQTNRIIYALGGGLVSFPSP